ncbi:MAG: hypothetical protein IJW55_07485 [Clostridia bacterium]|nr:hypothetical protein [Clostridia bacterium]
MNALLPYRMTNKERRAFEREVNRQTGENVKRLSLNLQALVLWSLRQQLGWGKKRLLRFQKNFLPLIEQLQQFYQAEDSEETEFICLYKLKNEVGIDVSALDEMFQIQTKINP